MAVAVQMDFVDGTLDQYDEVVRKMGFEARGGGAPGGLFHWATATEHGIRVVDVWEDRETFERFARAEILPLVAEVGITTEPVIEFYEVHNYFTAG